MSSKRDTAMELYRVMLMFGICLLHGFSQGAFVYVWPTRVLSLCLTAFVFISGWYGIKFSWRKVLGLIGIGWYCRYVGCIVYALLAGMDLPSLNPIHALLATKVYWFLWAYVALMMLAPLLNMAVDRVKLTQGYTLLPVFVLVFVWSFLNGMPMSALVPNAGGAGGLKLLAFVGIYLAARLFREYELERFVKGWMVLLLLLVSIGAAAVGVGHHMDSIFALAFAAVMFVVVKKCVFSRGDREDREWVFWSLRRLVGWLGPSLFSAYLLHTHMFGFGFLRRVDEAAVGFGCHPIIACVISAFAVFGLGILLDLPRRLLGVLWRRR